MMLSAIEPGDLQLIGGLISILLTALPALRWGVCRIVARTLRPNGGRPDSPSIHDQVIAVRSTIEERLVPIESRLAGVEDDLHGHAVRITALETHQRLDVGRYP